MTLINLGYNFEFYEIPTDKDIKNNPKTIFFFGDYSISDFLEDENIIKILEKE